MLSWELLRTHHLHAVLSPGRLSGKLHRQPPRKAAGAAGLPLLVPSSLLQEISVPERVIRGSSVYPVVAVLPCVWQGDKVQFWEATPVPANSRQPTLISSPCATWLTGRLSLLPHRLADIQEGAFDPAGRKNA